MKNGKQTDEVPGVKAAIKYLLVSYSTTMVCDFGPLSLEAVREQIIAVGNSRSYINKTANRIRRMFKWGVAKELVQVHQAFPSPEGTKGEALKAWRKKHRWAPNRLRHSRTTDIRRKYGLEASQAVLGHSNANVTQIYAERDIEKAAMIMAEVG